MEWRSEGIITRVTSHGEDSVIVEIFTKDQGRHLGLVRSGKSKKNRSLLQIGNHVSVFWQARLPEHLGTYRLELIKSYSSLIMHDKLPLFGLQLLCAHLHLMAERQPHQVFYRGVLHLLRLLMDTQDSAFLAAIMIRFETYLLAELGFGLNLKRCAATGTTQNLIYVSPKSASAVCEEAGKPYHDKLLRLPVFLRQEEWPLPKNEELEEGKNLMTYFLKRDIWEPRRLEEPIYRQQFYGMAL